MLNTINNKNYSWVHYFLIVNQLALRLWMTKAIYMLVEVNLFYFLSKLSAIFMQNLYQILHLQKVDISFGGLRFSL